MSTSLVSLITPKSTTLTKVALIDSQQVLYINQFDEKSSYKICVNANDISVSLKPERNSTCTLFSLLFCTDTAHLYSSNSATTALYITVKI
ncbi:hypothetical protein RC083_19265 [Pseudoalteromonas haloplanktis]|uniref:Orphan protein n=1 Tax=Pseudoalteromonas haloplanktis TaxID=228 RepID=A0ABU1BH19_PSEHA|nr:hypothetical protein [Pseudoalteromonas haloplanktis]MDQ9093715.1 hypothetical protein [Pseudoalteromonas haloplanktis]